MHCAVGLHIVYGLSYLYVGLINSIICWFDAFIMLLALQYTVIIFQSGHVTSTILNNLFVSFVLHIMGYWLQTADERLVDPPPRWFQEHLVVRDRDGRPLRGPSGSALLLYVWRECTAGRSWVSRAIFCLSCRFILWFSYVYSLCSVSYWGFFLCFFLYSTICSCVLISLV